MLEGFVIFIVNRGKERAFVIVLFSRPLLGMVWFTHCIGSDEIPQG